MAGLADLVQFDIATASPLAWAAVVVVAAYLAGAISLWRRGRSWSVLQTLSFVFGGALWFLATGLNANAYADQLVSVLLFQQITLMVVVPPFLLLGAPGCLLLRTTPHRGLGRTVLRAAHGAYRSAAARVLLNPVVAMIVAALAFPALYLSDTISLVLAVPGGHLILLTLLLVFGVIAGAPLWSRDPLPRKPSYVMRLVDVFVEIQIHAVFGLVLLLAKGPLFSWFSNDPEGWGITRLLDQEISGGMMWSYGELPLIIVLLVTLSKWRKTEVRSARHREKQEDADLDAYNDYLAAQRGRLPADRH